MSFFNRDLNKEEILGKYLDTIYPKLNLDFERVSDINAQHRGIDLIYKGKENVFIDEKAQLAYINKSLPTFTFELSYLKNKEPKIGWFIDDTKVTTHYFLITGIYANDKNDLTKGFKQCEITSVNRPKLLKHLNAIGLSKEKLIDYDKTIRADDKNSNKHQIEALDEKKEGLIYFSPQLAEAPINLQLRLDHLIDLGVAKKIYPK